MKKYDVYTLGNALVDIEFEVSTNTLEQLGIEKGVMTLIDETRHQQLLAHIGETKHAKACGGSAANALIALVQLGGKGFYSCKIADDDSGHFYLEDIHSHNVDTNLNSAALPPGTTGKCIVMVTPDAERTMNTYLGISDKLSTKELNPSAVQNSQYIYIEGYSATSEPTHAAALAAFDIARQHQVKTVFTLADPNIAEYYHTKYCEIIGGGVDLLFCNEEEAYAFTKTRDFAQVCHKMETLAKTFVITKSAKGSVVFDGQQYHDIKAVKVNAVDMMGAGDVYAGTFLYGLTHGYNYLQSAHLANFMAAQIVTIFGPRLTPAKTQALLRDYAAANLQAS